MNRRIRIAIVDDHELVRIGVKSHLTNNPYIDVVNEHSDGHQLIDAANREELDVVLLDLDMPVLNGIQTLEKLNDLKSSVRVIILSANTDENLVVTLMELGAKGYLLKQADAGEMEKAIVSVFESGYYFNDLVSNLLLKGLVSRNPSINPNYSSIEVLTEREIEVVKLICEEYTSKEIADRLYLSPRTVETHRNNAMSKAGVRNIAVLVVFSIRHKLIEI